MDYITKRWIVSRIIQSETRSKAYMQHTSRESAVLEAHRLAKENPHIAFGVFALETAFETADMPIKSIPISTV